MHHETVLSVDFYGSDTLVMVGLRGCLSCWFSLCNSVTLDCENNFDWWSLWWCCVLFFPHVLQPVFPIFQENTRRETLNVTTPVT